MCQPDQYPPFERDNVESPTRILCRVCGKDGGLLALSGPCFECARARQRAAMDGRCHCGNDKKPGAEKRAYNRRWIPCERCFGTIKQVA